MTWPNFVFSSELWRNRTSKISYDIILVMSLPLRHRKKRYKISHFRPPPIKIFGYASEMNDIIVRFFLKMFWWSINRNVFLFHTRN